MKQRIKITNLLAVITGVLICFGISALSAHAQLITVTNTNDSGAGSLRQAISDANADGFLDLIRFQIPTSDPNFANGVFTIRPASELPPLTDNVTAIDGATQTIFTGDTNPFGPEIEINGSLAGGGSTTAFTIYAANCTINSLVINGWSGFAANIDGYYHGAATTGNRLIGSYIGTDARGTTAVPNGYGSYPSILIGRGAAGNTIGGATADKRNVISGNALYGITIDNANGNSIQGNYIGTDATNSFSLPNSEYGIKVDAGAQGNTIGGTAASAGNFIATNGQDGVRVDETSVGNAIIGNSIFGNRRLGINLAGGNENGYGVTENDAGDADTGANNLQNYPVLTSARLSSGPVRPLLSVVATLNSEPNMQYAIQAYLSPSCDASGYGEGFVYFPFDGIGNDGLRIITTDASGNGNINFTQEIPNGNSLFVTLTATRMSGTTPTDTSEFSQCRKITGRAGREGDFDGDGKTDIGVFRPSNGVWYSINSTNGQFRGTAFGQNGDVPVSADYDSNGKTDFAVWRPSNGTWYILLDNGQFRSFQFGQSGDVPFVEDLDGDGVPDAGVFRPSNGVWYSLQSANGFQAVHFGQNGDRPVRGDFDGDGRADYAVFRPSSSTWFIQQSRAGFRAVQWGLGDDVPVPADYDGDGKTNVAVFRRSNGGWYILNPDGSLRAELFGQNGDVPVPGDYDGDGRYDIGVFRPSNGSWYIDRSGLRFSAARFGANGDVPVPFVFDGF